MSGVVFALCLIAALCADSAPWWSVLSMVGIAGLVSLVWGVMGFASGKFPNDCDYGRKKTAPGAMNTKDGKQNRKSPKQSIYRHYGDFRGKSQL